MTHLSSTPNLRAARPGMRVLAIAGSLRRDSWNLRLLEAAAGLAPAGMTIDVHRDLGAIPMFNEDLEHESGVGPDAVQQLRHEVARADGLLIATPEYNQSIPGVLKNTLDWLSRAAPDEVLVGKPIAVMGATAGRWGTRLAQHALRQTLTAAEALVMPSPALYLGDAPSLFDSAGRLSHGGARESLQDLLGAFSSWIERVSPGRTNAGFEPAPDLDSRS